MRPGRLRVAQIAGALLLAGGAALFAACSRASADVGPNGGDVVAVPNTDAKAEVIGNADTGEVSVRTYDENLTNRNPCRPSRWCSARGTDASS
jgi:hypothetical protein